MGDSGYTFLGQPVGTTSGTVAAGNHTHAGADVTSGTVAYARLPVGTAASTVAAGDDGRFTYTEPLTVGEFVPARHLVGSQTITPTTGTLALFYFTAAKTETINTITVYSGNTAAAATPTLIRMGIYSVAGNGDLTLIASTPNDTTLLAATVTAYPKALSASFSKVAGTRYCTAFLQVTSTTAATLHGLQMAGTTATTAFSRVSPPICGRLVAQTDLPSSISAGSLAGFQGVVAMMLS